MPKIQIQIKTKTKTGRRRRAEESTTALLHCSSNVTIPVALALKVWRADWRADR